MRPEHPKGHRADVGNLQSEAPLGAPSIFSMTADISILLAEDQVTRTWLQAGFGFGFDSNPKFEFGWFRGPRNRIRFGSSTQVLRDIIGFQK